MPHGKSTKSTKRRLKPSKKSGTNGSTGTLAPSTGRRKGTKRSDLRYIAPDGSEWASPFEYRVYVSLLERGLSIRRTTSADALSYSTPVKNGECENCGSVDVCQRRIYTPDLVLWPVESAENPRRNIYLETKGYFPASKRNLFRAARQSNPQVDVRLVVSSNHWVTKGKTRLTDWAKRFKIPIHVWDGALPEEWL